MQLRNLRYLLALEHERHFARAAQACNVSQPTLSAGLHALEVELGRRLVDRDRRFIGFTAEGRAVLPWARQVVAAVDSLSHATQAAAGPLKGQLRLGAIPASMPISGRFGALLRRMSPEVELAIYSLTSREIAQRLAAYELDAGLTYIDHEPPAHMMTIPLYAEHMVFVEHADAAPPAHGGPTLDAVLNRPLCLLHQRMQNRRILDANLAALGRAISPVATADSYVALLALVQTGAFATIMPDSYAPLLPSWARMAPLDPPLPASRIGLVVPDRSPLEPLAHAALEVAGRIAPAF